MACVCTSVGCFQRICAAAAQSSSQTPSSFQAPLAASCSLADSGAAPLMAAVYSRICPASFRFRCTPVRCTVETRSFKIVQRSCLQRVGGLVDSTASRLGLSSSGVATERTCARRFLCAAVQRANQRGVADGVLLEP